MVVFGGGFVSCKEKNKIVISQEKVEGKKEREREREVLILVNMFRNDLSPIKRNDTCLVCLIWLVHSFQFTLHALLISNNFYNDDDDDDDES